MRLKDEFKKEKSNKTNRLVRWGVPLTVLAGITLHSLFGGFSKETKSAFDPNHETGKTAVSGEHFDEAGHGEKQPLAAKGNSRDGAKNDPASAQDSGDIEEESSQSLTPEDLQRPVFSEYYDNNGNLLYKKEVTVENRMEELRQALQEKVIEVADGVKIAPVFYVEIGKDEVANYDSVLGVHQFPVGPLYREASYKEVLSINPDIMNIDSLEMFYTIEMAREQADQGPSVIKLFLNNGWVNGQFDKNVYASLQFRDRTCEPINKVVERQGRIWANNETLYFVGDRPASEKEKRAILDNKELANKGFPTQKFVPDPPPSGNGMCGGIKSSKFGKKVVKPSTLVNGS